VRPDAARGISAVPDPAYPELLSPWTRVYATSPVTAGAPDGNAPCIPNGGDNHKQTKTARPAPSTPNRRMRTSIAAQGAPTCRSRHQGRR